MIDTGDTAWVITATALVMLMTPALGFFYGGLVRRKNLVATIVQCLAIFSVISLVWALWGYTMTFGPRDLWGWGHRQPLEGRSHQRRRDPEPCLLGQHSRAPLLRIPAQVRRDHPGPDHRCVRGAGATEVAADLHRPLDDVGLRPDRDVDLEPGGWLHALGVVDFAGGLVVHTSAGVSAVAAALVIGTRSDARGPGEPPEQRPVRHPRSGAPLVRLVRVQRREARSRPTAWP